MDTQKRLDLFAALARKAGTAILAARTKGTETRHKADRSPVTEADETAEAIILEGLQTALLNVPVLAEEAVAAQGFDGRPEREFILVDPLDGTREFVSGSAEFTVNIALVRDGVPVEGVVYLPISGTIYRGGPDGATRNDVSIRTSAAASPVRVLASRSHRSAETDGWIARLSERCGCEIVRAGSSLKFGRLAEGAADIYPRHGRTMLWDTAAGDAVLRAAGGMTFGPDGTPLRYGVRGGDDPLVNPNFVAVGRGGFPGL